MTKIEAVRTHILEHRLDTAFESASARFDARQHLLVEVICEDGTTGWGECLGPVGPNAAMVAAYGTRLKGRDPRMTDAIWLDLYHTFRDQGQRGLAITALSGIDIALWDIKGRLFDVPIATLLGARHRDEVLAYATGSFRRVGVARVTDNADECARHVIEGFQAVKIKIGFGVEEDLAVTAAVRDAIGPETRLMCDANHGYDEIEAIEFGNRAGQFSVDWFEEPVLPEQLDSYTRLRARQPIPVAGGETWHGRYGQWEALRRGCVDILQPDICGSGGFSEMRRIADLAEISGTRLVPHVWGTAVQIAASLQFIAAMAPTPPRPEPREPILEFDRTDNPFRQAVVKTPIEPISGIVKIPDGPGLGVEIDRDALSRFAAPD